MNHKTNVNTTLLNTQANNANIALLACNTIRQHLGDIESQAVGILALGEMVFDQLDTLRMSTAEPGILNIVQRIDALVIATSRNASLVDDASTAISLALESYEVSA